MSVLEIIEARHFAIAVAYFLLGGLGFAYFLTWLLRNKIKIDHELNSGDTIRLTDKLGRIWIIYNPSNLVQLTNAIILSFSKNGSGKVIDKQTKRRTRVIAMLIFWSLALLLTLALWFTLDAIEYDDPNIP